MRSVRGTPSSLLNDRLLAADDPASAQSTPASRSLVDVLPADPVMPTTRSGRRRARPARRAPPAPRSCRPPRSPTPATRALRAVRYAFAPARSAASMKSWPSRAAGTGTNSSPPRDRRGSRWSRRRPRHRGRASVPPTTAATSRRTRLHRAGAPRARRRGRRTEARAPPDHLAGLVTLARDHHDVAGRASARASRMAARRSGSTRNAPRAARAGAHLGDDRVGVLVPGVVRRQHRHVGVGRGGRAHERALVAVAIAAAPEHHDHAPVRATARGGRRAAGARGPPVCAHSRRRR